MASTRPSKPPRKSAADNPRRSAWSGPRASPTFAPTSSSPRPQASAPQQGPPLAQTNGARPSDPTRDRVLQSLAGLTGTTVTLTTKTGVRYEGVVGSTSSEGDTSGVTLRDVKDLTAPGTPLKDAFFIASSNIESYTSGPADAKPANGDTFRTDTDISQKKPNQGRERELQMWQPDNDAPPLAGDDDTFGHSASNTAWDQFAVNEKLFGVTGGFNEDDYTTKLDRNAAGFKEREIEAQRIAAEILGVATNNPHIREERGLDDSSVGEEDKYGAVVRSQGAYIPPGARRGVSGALSPPSIPSAAPSAVAKQEVPKVSVNGPDGTTVAQTQTPPDKTSSPAPGAAAAPKDALPAFRDFVTTEKQRLTRKRQALVKSEMDKRMAELVKFSQNFKLNKPIPDDLVPILAKDEDKQRAIKEKAKKDAESNSARAIGASTAVTASRGVGIGGALKGAMKQPTGGAPAVGTSGLQKPPVSQQPSSSSTAQTASSQKPAGPTASKSETAVKKIPMYIQPIPAFKGGKLKQTSTPSAATASSSAVSGASGMNGSVTPATATTTATTSPTPGVATPVSPTTATSANRLNVNASSFRPTMKASSPTPTNVASPKSKADTPNSTATVNNPFFGVRPLKKSSVTHIKDDFNPFKSGKVLEAGQVAPQWPYHGKRYTLMFPAVPHPPSGHPSHMGSGPNTPGNAGGNTGGPPVQQHVPPPPYEEDPNAQAAAAAARGGYVYPYPPYAYPGQHMMPPPGPPGAYMPAPFMHHMPYPPGMPPPNAMYSPAMGQMPPYMPPPPPGPYPPPPNGAAPRPSMPPTPIPAQAHPYYHHQSPQLQHAVPYSMMMPPPPGGVPPHPYENGPPPPVQMGGHA
ncbi:hypothetical protein D9756_003474 [Leucocoprinus leucothites]|uniref:LsmAD domain-containing protein n=1 Tax=Leucocoprinus leucothites TaxID=201217 RepID=A0A8H5LJF8_9AGAR|nr:hypothetical protein D9756_003474 [Leucoagaricus leucothites]